ncbi:tetratricopeptide repeat protein [Sphingopyxis terrae]|uniref:tetratricopeptide repeat protein n=1 Tax=Sphingopyxis terrae TaxID=33052 RepID=UPI003F81FFBE
MAIGPRHSVILAKRAAVLLDLDKPEEALADADAALAAEPGNFEARIMQAQAIAKLGDLAKALAQFDKLIAENPQPFLYSLRGDARLDARNYAEAAADYSEVLKHGSNAPTLSARGWAYRMAGELGKAIADFDAAIRSDPTLFEAYTGRGEAYVKLDEDERAVADFTKALKLQPGHAGVLRERGSAYSELGKLALAIADYDTALSIEPKNSDMLNGRCWARAVAGAELAKALADCNAAITLAPKEANTYDSRGLVKLKLGDNAAAFADYDTAAKMDPTRASYFYGRGIAAIRLGRRAEGEADLAKAGNMDVGVAARYAKHGVTP